MDRSGGAGHDKRRFVKRRDFLKIAAGAGIAGGGLLTWKHISDKVPRKTSEGRNINVILLSIDCLNQRQFAAAAKDNIVPQIQSVERDFLVFSQCYAHSPWTNPSHMSMLTGLYPNQHGRDIPYPLMLDPRIHYDRVPLFSSLADYLSDYRYETMAITGSGSVSAHYGLGKGFDRYLESAKDKDNSDLTSSMPHFEKWITSRNRERPFFLFFHTYDLHAPMARWTSSLSSQENLNTCLAHIDSYVGKVFALLRKEDCYDSTLIFVTGDHGSAMVETYDKCCYHGAGHYQENLKVPLMVKLPGSTITGEEDRLARHVDIYPTVIDCLGLSRKTYPGPGMSLLRRRGKNSGQNVPEVSFSNADGAWQCRCALVTDKYKYIYTPRNIVNMLLRRIEEERGLVKCKDGNPCCSVDLEELYDIKRDPFEHVDLLRSKKPGAQLRGVISDFRRSMVKHLNMPVAYNTVVGDSSMFDSDSSRSNLSQQEREHFEALRNLGYIQ